MKCDNKTFNVCSRIQHQYNQLEQEYRIAAMGVFRHNRHIRRVSGKRI